VASTFKFGQANGVLIGILAAHRVPMHFITPGTWTKHYGLDADKEAFPLAMQGPDEMCIPAFCNSPASWR
jgi:hypothetical protein